MPFRCVVGHPATSKRQRVLVCACEKTLSSLLPLPLYNDRFTCPKLVTILPHEVHDHSGTTKHCCERHQLVIARHHPGQTVDKDSDFEGSPQAAFTVAKKEERERGKPI